MSSEAEKDFVVPDHLTREVFRKCLEKDLKEDNIRIVHFEITPGSNPGDNYTSKIYRCKVIYNQPHTEDKTVHLIAKSIIIPTNMPDNDFNDNGIIEKEMDVYQELLPKLSKFLNGTVVAPKCYDIFTEPNQNFIFEDMKALGYACADRVSGLDADHLKVVLNKIAKFHAASMKLLEEEPSTQDAFNVGFFSEQTLAQPLFVELFRGNLKLAVEILNEIPGYEHFSPKLLKIYDNFVDIALKVVELDPVKDIKVINHGDLWVNNFLFKYDEETKEPTDVVFVDYQGTFVNSLAIDINYLFATSAQVNVIHRKLDLVEKYYYPVFANELRKLAFQPVPSLEDIFDQIKSREMFSIINLFTVLPLISINREESKTNDFTQFLDADKSKRKMLIGMSSDRFKETMKFTLKNLEDVIDKTINKYT
ncbi:uncharacterized protein LOC119658249 [Hermetia illucens]|uniref:uncharacterized protein LOC119658249 n=1 Tax=Hermetia illucens TaxID=343691 RepID=UPI0018CC079F|nr:uncharacterized protein LOC119658249 [Hermetia illucens]